MCRTEWHSVLPVLRRSTTPSYGDHFTQAISIRQLTRYRGLSDERSTSDDRRPPVGRVVVQDHRDIGRRLGGTRGAYVGESAVAGFAVAGDGGGTRGAARA